MSRVMGWPAGMNINNMSVAKVNNMLGEAVCLPSYATMLLSVVKSSESPWWAHKKKRSLKNRRMIRLVIRAEDRRVRNLPLWVNLVGIYDGV